MIARRYAAQPRNKQTLGNWFRELAQFMIAPLSPGFNLDRYDRELRRPFPSEPQLAPEGKVWRRTVSPTLPSLQRPFTRRPLRPPAALNGWNLNRGNLCSRNVATPFFRQHRIQLHHVGNRHRPIHLARTSPPTTGRSVAASAHPPQLPLHRAKFLVPGVVSPDLPSAFAHSAAYGDIIAAMLALFTLISLPSASGVVIAWIFSLCGTADLFNAFYQSRRPHGGAVGCHLFHSDFHRAPTADHARTRFPDSSATSKCIRGTAKPPLSIKAPRKGGVLFFRTGYSICGMKGRTECRMTWNS